MVRIIGVLIMSCSMLTWADPILKDPTQPYQIHSKKPATETVVVQEEAFQVTSILKRKRAAWVIVNGIKANVGDRVGRAKIVQIAFDKVLLDTGDSQRWVSLSSNFGLKKSR